MVIAAAVSIAVAAGTALVAAVCASKAKRRLAKRTVVELKSLPKEKVPLRLKPEFYFDFKQHAFEHSALLDGKNVVEIVGALHEYAEDWLQKHSQAKFGEVRFANNHGAKTVGALPPVFLEPGTVKQDGVFAPDVLIGPLGSSTASNGVGMHVGSTTRVLGGTFDLRAGGIWLGEGVVVEPGVHIAGPAIIGKGTTLRCGAYLRGDVVVGEKVVLRGELKNSLVMDCAELAHPGYCGDSIIGYKGHFGCQALTANLGLFGAELSAELPDEGTTRSFGVVVKLGRRKLGTILGDGSQLGCGTVADPGTFIGPRTHVYPLARLASGFYGPDQIIKNKPADCGVLVRSPLK